MSMTVAGVMRGTSADGINVALVQLPTRGRGRPRYTLLGHEEYPFTAPVRRAILEMMNAELARVADLARLSFLLGELYAEAVAKTARKHRVKLDLVGCHGQTLYHQGVAHRFLGRQLAVTWQIGEAAVIAARLGVPVVSDFRPADMAAGGKGAPLVPLLDYVIFRANDRGRSVQNIGGSANLTAIRADAQPGNVQAFDTGPGNMVIDQLMQMLFDKPFDRGGAVARSGSILHPVLKELLGAPYFKLKPPKTAGREEFGSQYAEALLRRCGQAA